MQRDRPERLDIIGNGFDLFHGIPSNYSDFALFLAEADRAVSRMIGEYFFVDEDFWSTFETRLAEFDAEGAVEYASGFLDDKGYGDFQYELEQIGRGLSVTLQRHFANWVRSLVIPQPGHRPLLALGQTDRFLTFNYTATLERLYGVPADRILHIHGQAEDASKSLVLGHGWERRPEDSLNFGPEDPDQDWRVREGIEHIDAYFEATFKPTQAIIARSRAFFDSLSDVSEVRILGHGLHEVDTPYIEAVMNAVDLTRVSWTVSTFNDLEKRRAVFGAYGVPESLVTYKALADC